MEQLSLNQVYLLLETMLATHVERQNSKGLFKLKIAKPLSRNWHYRITASKRGYKTVSKYVLVKGVSNKRSNQSSKAIQDQIASLNKQIASLQKKIASLNQTPQTVYINSSTNNSGNDNGSDSYDKNKDYWAGPSQNMYVADYSLMLYTDGNAGSDSVDRIFGETDKIHTIKTWVNNSVNGLYPVEYGGKKLFASKDDVINIDSDNSSKQLYSVGYSYYANYSPEDSNVRTFNGLNWTEYTPTRIYYWEYRDGNWHNDA
ncbi:hypothetical protein AZI11_12995 (plasmid) [Levilactobacillus brevis]|uniref:FlxA-like family protein n=1 Tax=Levilactobacillus brevis TaxID=1580 RepID=UPI000A20718A|nr:FlxA-like family protein [Levilactobacillus brevis]ARN93856.1 hypothetical protein AZI11_12995 [Levilactobacillus brevis]ARN96392.1 hypothetical protein AZI12_12865 [Levilactobacillus brevis]